MNRTTNRNPAAAGLFLCLVACSTRSESSGPTVACGEGTRLEEGLCVLAPLTSCPDGEARVDGTCRPLCGPNTTGSAQGCVPASGACGEGTFLDAGRCVATDPMSGVTVRENAEPNGSLAQATAIDLSTGTVTLGGVVEGPGEQGGDFDLYRFELPAGRRLTVTLDSVGGPQMAARLFPADHADANRWSSYLFNARGPKAERTFDLPFGGAWALEVSAADNFPGRGGLPVGGPAFLYRASLVVTQAPAPVPLDRPGEGLSGVGRFDAPAAYQIAGNPIDAAPLVYALTLERHETEPPLDGLRRLSVLTPDGRTLALSVDSLNDGRIAPMNDLRVLVPPEGAVVRVDHVYSDAPERAFHLTGIVEAADLPTVPGTDVPGSLEGDNLQEFAFDAPPDSVIRLLMRRPAGSSLSSSVKCELRDPAGEQRDTVTLFGNTLDAYSGRDGGRFWVVCEDQRFDPAGAAPYLALDIDFLPVVRVFSPIAAEEHLMERMTLPPLAPNLATSRFYAAFHVDSPMLVKSAAQSVTGQAKVVIRLVRETLEELVPQSSPGAATTSEIPVLLQPGDYFVEVSSTRSSSSSADGEVDVALDVFEPRPCLAEAEPNDSPALSQELQLAPGDVTCVDAAWQSDEKYDFFRFKVASTSRLRIVMMNRDGDALQKLSVLVRQMGSSTNLASQTVVGSATASMTVNLSANVDYELVVGFSVELFGARSMPGGYTIGFSVP